MSINVQNLNFANIDPAKLATKIDEFNKAQGANGVKATMATGASNNNVVISLSYGDKTTQLNLTLVNEIDPADVNADETAEALKTLAAKLEAMANDLKNDAQTPPPPSVGSIHTMLFDIYDLIRQLMETAQEQKKVASIVRTTSSESVQAQMMAEAADIRENANAAFGLGLASAIIGTCGLAASAIMTCVGMGKELSAMKNNNADAAKTNMDNINQELEDLKAGKPGAGQQIELTEDMMKELGFSADELKGKTPEQMSDMFKAKFMPESLKAEGELNKAWGEVEQQQKIVDTEKSALSAAEEKCAAQEKQVSADQGKIDDLNKQFDDKIAESDKKVADAEKGFNDAKTELEAAKADYEAKSGDPAVQERFKNAQSAFVEKEAALKDAKATRETEVKQINADRETQLKPLQEQLDADKATLASDRKSAGEIGERLNKAQQKLGELNVKYADALHDCQTARESDLKAVDRKIAECDKAVQEAAKKSPDGSEKDIENRKDSVQQLKEFRKQFESVNDLVANSEAKQQAAIDGFKIKTAKAVEDFNQRVNLMVHDSDYKNGEQLVNLANTVNGLGNSIGQWLGAFKERVQAQGEASLKEKEAAAEKTRNVREDAVDLGHEAQENFKNFMGILKDLTELEHQFMGNFRPS